MTIALTSYTSYDEGFVHVRSEPKGDANMQSLRVNAPLIIHVHNYSSTGINRSSLQLDFSYYLLTYIFVFYY